MNVLRSGGVRAAALVAVAGCLVAGGRSALAGKATPDPWGNRRLTARIGSVEVPQAAAQRIAVDQAVGEIDAATIDLGGKVGLSFAQGLRVGDDLAVDAAAGTSADALFKGEVVGIEPVFDQNGKTVVVIRAFNRMHRLTRGKKSRTFSDVSDADLVKIVASENGLKAAPSGDLTERFDFVVQHNETDLEFLRVRAARLGFHVWCEDTTLHFGKPEETPPVVLSPWRPDGETKLLDFLPRLSSAKTVQKVIVRGWDPDKAHEIVGTATLPTILLVAGPNDPDFFFGAVVVLEVDVLHSQEEADALARAELDRIHAERIAAEAASNGNPRLRPGIVVQIDGVGARFDGKYLIQGCTHRMSDGGLAGSAYDTLMRIATMNEGRDRGLFCLPEVNDEVLVAFEHGDISRPIVVGSLWNGTDKPTDDHHRQPLWHGKDGRRSP